ncbi:hypothetical protein D1BOALGB6SA_10181 [Olavius sp. associated proteobacterium Delta 1]|nr:hypothetical protein D1BOALGB6SA_10181 [Olavius sp. associated proteobacterium Delta 1]
MIDNILTEKYPSSEYFSLSEETKGSPLNLLVVIYHAKPLLGGAEFEL